MNANTLLAAGLFFAFGMFIGAYWSRKSEPEVPAAVAILLAAAICLLVIGRALA